MNSRKPVSIQNVTLAWNKFLESGEVDNDIIRQPIFESWIRSSNLGVNPWSGVCKNILEQKELDRIRERKAQLLNTVQPLIEYYYQIVKSTGAIFVLTDEYGYIINITGDSNVLEDGKKLNFIQGASWVESEVGTNAIAASLEIKKPMSVTASEHFCRKHHDWTCSAAPILDPSGKLLGIIDISGPSRTYNRHTLGFAAAIASSSTMGLAVQKKGQELISYDRRFTHIFDNSSDGIVEVDSSGNIKDANPVACSLFMKTKHEILGKLFDRMFPVDGIKAVSLLESPRQDFECFIQYKNEKRKYLLSGEPIFDETGVFAGGIILIKHVKQQGYFVNIGKKGNSSGASYTFSDIIGNCPLIIEAKQIAKLASRGTSNVLLQGESGTGKEIYAQSIHNESPRKNGPFIAVNCGAIPRDLIGSELFGYEEGTFTGAKRGGKIGKFEMADGGTLFLDEIGDMPLEHQIALLRVLQERKITRIGGNRDIPVDTRIICASNKNLLGEVIKGNFRQDLYYRLNIIKIDIPPLRQRGEDIILLFNYFLKRFEQSCNKTFTVESQVLSIIEKYHWPGNVRELQNVVERLVTISEDGRIKASGLPKELTLWYQEPQHKDVPVDYATIYADKRERKHESFNIEKQKIIFMLDRCRGNVTLAARELGISRNTLYRKMRMYGINN